MKVNNTLTITPFLLKTAGGLLVLASLIEYILLFFPAAVADSKLLEQYWKIDFWGQLVNSGVVPLVGMLLIFAGYWMNYTLNLPVEKRPAWKDLRFCISVLATLLGIVYLVTIPIFLNNANWLKEQTVKNINDKADIEIKRVNQQLEQVNAQIAQYQKVASDKPKLEQQIARLNQDLNSGQLQGQQLEQTKATRDHLEILKNNAQLLEQSSKQAQEAAKKERERINTEVGKTKSIAESHVILLTVKTNLKSLILAIAYTLVGWFGLRNVFASGEGVAPVDKWE